MEQIGQLQLRRDSFNPSRTLIVLNGTAIGSLAWEECDVLARNFRLAARAGRTYAETAVLPALEYERTSAPFDLRPDPFDPARTLIVMNAQEVGSVPWDKCDEIAASFTRAARAGEEYAKAPAIIAQQALLTRTGAPFGLSDNPKIMDAAYSDAQWDSAARKGMPLRGAPSRRRCGTPTLIHHRRIGAH